MECMRKAPHASKERKGVEMASVAAKKRSFDAGFKLKVVHHADQHSNREAARMFGTFVKAITKLGAL